MCVRFVHSIFSISSHFQAAYTNRCVSIFIRMRIWMVSVIQHTTTTWVIRIVAWREHSIHNFTRVGNAFFSPLLLLAIVDTMSNRSGDFVYLQIFKKNENIENHVVWLPRPCNSEKSFSRFNMDWQSRRDRDAIETSIY